MNEDFPTAASKILNTKLVYRCCDNMEKTKEEKFQELCTKIWNIEIDEEYDNKESITKIIPCIILFMQKAIYMDNFDPIMLKPTHISECDGVGIRLDWDINKKFLSIIAKSNYKNNCISLYHNDGINSEFITNPKVTKFIEIFKKFYL